MVLRQQGAPSRKAGAPFSIQALSETVPVVGGGEIDERPDRHDAGWIDLPLAAVIMPLDLIDVNRLGNSGHRIEVAQIIPQVGIIGDTPQVAFEMTVIDGVKANERGKEPPIRFGDLPPDQIALPR